MAKKRKKRPKIYAYKSNRLMWPPKLYEEWYYHAKLADNTIGTFKEWFDVEQYAEPMQDDDVKVLEQMNNKLVLEFDLTHDLARTGINFLKVLTKYQSEYTYHSLANKQPSKSAKNITLKTLKQRRHVYMLKQQGMKNPEIARKLKLITKEVYDWKKLSTGGNKHNPDPDTIKKLEKLEAIIAKQSKNKDKEDLSASLYSKAERTIQRHVDECEKTLKNVSNGSFP